MIRPILRYGDSTLHDPAQPVAAITGDVERLVDDMIETMYAAPGVGLAATQVGVPLRIFVVDISMDAILGAHRDDQPGVRRARRRCSSRKKAV